MKRFQHFIAAFFMWLMLLTVGASTGSRFISKNQYLRIDICIKSNVVVSKKVSIDHPCKWSKNVYFNRKSICKFKNCDSNRNAQFITDFFVLITWVGPTMSSVFFIGDLSLVGEPPSGVRNSGCPISLFYHAIWSPTMSSVFLLTILPWLENHHPECEIRLVFRLLLQTITVTNVKSNFYWQI